MENKEFLSQVGLFRGMSPEELNLLRGCFVADQREAGEVIFSEGEEARYICVVLEGSVDLRFEMPGRESSKETNLATVLPGKAFGWSALVPPYKITLSSYAGAEKAVFLKAKREDLVKLFEENPNIGYLCMRNLARVIAKRFFKMEDAVARLEGLNVMHKW